MDWELQASGVYLQRVSQLFFESRPSKCYRISASPSSTQSSVPSLTTADIADDAAMEGWLQMEKTRQPTAWPNWSLTILALKRGPPNEFEKTGNGSADQLSYVGCSKRHFQEIIEVFEISKNFPSCIVSDQSHYTRHIAIDASNEWSKMTFNVRSGQLTLRDLAFCSVSRAATASTFVLILGCNDRDFRRLASWLNVMKEYGGYPLLSVAIFLELYHKRLAARHRELRLNYFQSYTEVFGTDVAPSASSDYRQQLKSMRLLDEQIDALDAELTAFRLRLPDVMSIADSISNKLSF